MQDKVFRKTSIDRLSSPEQLNEYMRVVTPSVWLVLGAIIVILIGMIVWGCSGTLESRLSAVAASDGMSEPCCYIPADRMDDVSDGMPVIIDGNKYFLGNINSLNLYSGGEIGKYLAVGGDYDADKYFCRVPVIAAIPPGVYECEIVLGKISPVRFLLNSGADK